MFEYVLRIVVAFQEHRFNQFVQLRIMTKLAFIVVTDTRTRQSNARELLNQTYELNYFYTESLGFVGGVAMLQDTTKVFLYGFVTEPHHINFVIKVTSSCKILSYVVLDVTNPPISNICHSHFDRVYSDIARPSVVTFVYLCPVRFFNLPLLCSYQCQMLLQCPLQYYVPHAH